MVDQTLQVATLSAKPSSIDTNLTEDATPTALSLSQKTNLLDLPNEILERIFKAALAGEHISFTVACGGTIGDEVQYDDLRKHSWSLAWVPDLRLVSSTFKNITSPVIAKQVGLRVIRTHDTTEQHLYQSKYPLDLALACPTYFLPWVRRTEIWDHGMAHLMQPARKVQVGHFERLSEVVYGPIDAAQALESAYKAIAGIASTTDKEVFLKRQAEGMCLVLHGSDPMSARYLQQVEALARFALQVLALTMNNAENYLKMMKRMVGDYWQVEWETVEGLAENASLRIIFKDSEADKVVSWS